MIGVIDYGLGNVSAFVNVYRRLNIPVTIVRSSAELRVADHLILPGVGAFDHAVGRLTESGMGEALVELVIRRHVPVLGVCVGMQMLARRSAEGRSEGLGWIDGEVRKLESLVDREPVRLPHMGWNDVSPIRKSRLFSGLEQGARFYFLHSYYFVCESPDEVLAESYYGVKFGCAVGIGNIYGVQFHPEKSHEFGVQLLKNFASL